MEKIWVYQLNRALEQAEEQSLLQELHYFVASWDAHGQLLAARAEIRHHHFVILGVDVQKTPPSGCAVDKSVHVLKKLEERFDVRLFDRMTLACFMDEHVTLFTKSSLKEAFEQGLVNEDTPFFNNLIESYEQLETDWLIPLKNSWVFRFLESPAPSN